jgi:hypothetical protein
VHCPPQSAGQAVFRRYRFDEGYGDSALNPLATINKMHCHRNPRQFVQHLSQRVILIDEEALADLMIEHGVGVRTFRAIVFRRLDEDFFSEDDYGATAWQLFGRACDAIWFMVAAARPQYY